MEQSAITLCIRVPLAIAESLREEAQALETSVNALVNQILENHIGNAQNLCEYEGCDQPKREYSRLCKRHGLMAMGRNES